jgi:hypothetical protein
MALPNTLQRRLLVCLSLSGGQRRQVLRLRLRVPDDFPAPR